MMQEHALDEDAKSAKPSIPALCNQKKSLDQEHATIFS